MIRDITLFVIIGFVVACMFLVAFVAYDYVNDSFQELDDLDPDVKATLNEWETTMPRAWDWSFLLIIVAISAGIIIISYYLQSQPILFVVYWLIVMLLSIAAGYLSNAFDVIISDETLGNAALSFPITTFIMENYLLFTMVLGFAMIFVFIAKPSDAGAGY